MATSVARLPGQFRYAKPLLRCACAHSCPNSHASWRQRSTGVWALTDNGNNLFNVHLSADGSAVSTSGVDGVPPDGSRLVYTITAAPGSQPTALSGLELRVAP